MADQVEITVEGLRETQEKMEQMVSDLTGPPMLTGMRDAMLKVQRDAKINAPVDTGRLQSSIWPEVRVAEGELQGIVGSKVEYAPYMEFGTGVFSEKPLWVYGAAAMGVGKVRHWPPAEALNTWAERHGFESGYIVARIIGLRGGLQPRFFLKKALESNMDYIRRKIGDAVGEIVRK